MKHTAADQARLHLLLETVGVALEPGIDLILLSYLEEVIRINQTLNLTRIDSLETGIRLHLVDSLVALAEVDASPPGSLIDIGTGGGFPGVPLCVASGRKGVLLDSVSKKARAVSAALSSAGIDADISTLAERAETHAARGDATYAVVTARAVAELPALVELAAPLLVPGGRLVALKGAPAEQEIARADRVAEAVGMRRMSVSRLTLPDGGERRAIIVFERNGASRVKLPRRVGLAQSCPLA